MAVSEEDLQAKREQVEKLRGQITDEQAKRAERQAAVQREIDAAQLDAEAERLEAQLAREKELSKAGSVKEAASRPLQQAKEQEKAAQTQAAAQRSGDSDKE